MSGKVRDSDMPEYHVAQINIGRALAPLDDPLLAGFMSQLDEINALADTSPGFVWRLQSDSGNATDIQAFADPRMLVNLSVWESLESLFEFVYRSGHAAVMARRREWFELAAGPYMALWWVPAGHLPGVEEAIGRLDHLERHGPTPEAFSFKQRFAAPSDGSARAFATETGAAPCS